MDKLGKKLRDKVTGYTGVAACYETSPFTMGRYHMSAQVSDKGEIPPGYSFDETDLEVLDEGKQYLDILPEQEAKVNVLDKVEDTITGYKGIAVAKLVYANGCVKWAVVPKDKDKKEDDAKSRIIADGRLTVIKESKAESVTPRTGGPSERSPTNIR